MKALTWEGTHNVELKNVREPKILRPRDAIVRVTSTAICGSDLHLYDGVIPSMKKGDILGHETMGEVIEVGSEVKVVKVGDKIVIPFDIACGTCQNCDTTQFAACDNSNPHPLITEKALGHPGNAMFGYSHMYGGYAGGQAEFIRVPYVDTNSLVIPSGIDDEKVLFLSDIFPTGYMAAENCSIKRGDTVAIWGAGPVGQMAIRSAFMLGAERVIAIDHYGGRLKLAAEAGAETMNFDDVDDVVGELTFRTGGVGPDSCMDAVGMEAHGSSVIAALDKVKVAVKLGTDQPNALRQAVQACKKTGTVSVPGVYAGVIDKFPFGAAFGKGLTMKMGQTHTQRYMKPLLDRILNDEIDPSVIISHRLKLEDGPEAYKNFHENKSECIKVVMKM